jgi:hypothetical protein
MIARGSGTAEDKSKVIVWTPKTTLPRVRREVALALKEIDR